MKKTSQMQLTAITIEEMITNEAKSYNEKVWVEKVKRFASYPNCKFYFIPENEIFKYTRFFVTYQIPEGINLFTSFGYSSCLTNNSFCVVIIRENEAGTFDVTTSEIKAGGKMGRVANHKEGRKFMSFQSRNYDTIFSNDI